MKRKKSLFIEKGNTYYIQLLFLMNYNNLNLTGDSN